jgi:hypothetical protein
MSASLLTPDLRRILDDLARRLGILERRTGRTAPQAGPLPNHSHNGTGTDSVVLADTSFPAVASGQESTAGGDSAIASGQYASAYGGASQATAQFATAVGDAAEATATNATAVGSNSVAGHNTSVAVGYAATTTGTHQIMLGTASETVVCPGNLSISGTVSGFTGGGDRIPAAHTFTTTTVSGFGIVSVFTGTDNGAAVALMLSGDTKPRVLLRADGQVLLGDGTSAPADAGMYLESARIVVYSANGVLLDGGDLEVNSGDILCSGGGPVLYAPDNSAHRIVVSNAGVLSTVSA